MGFEALPELFCPANGELSPPKLFDERPAIWLLSPAKAALTIAARMTAARRIVAMATLVDLFSSQSYGLSLRSLHCLYLKRPYTLYCLLVQFEALTTIGGEIILTGEIID